MTVTLECVGGPLDGEIRLFEDGVREFRIPLMPSCVCWDIETLDVMSGPSVRWGLYVRGTLRIAEWWTDEAGKHTRILHIEALRWEGEQ